LACKIFSEAGQAATHVMPGQARTVDDHPVKHGSARVEMAWRRRHQGLGGSSGKIRNLCDALRLTRQNRDPVDAHIVAELIGRAKVARGQPRQKTERGLARAMPDG